MSVCEKTKWTGLTSYQLKWIAVLSMITDHIGAVFYPDEQIFHQVGRIAFPIFAYLLVEGLFHTRDVFQYMMRLGIFAVVSEIPFDLLFQGRVLEFSHQNIFFTLFLGVFMMYELSMPGNWKVRGLKAILIMWASSVLRVDYSYMGILLIFIYYQMHRLCRGNKERVDTRYLTGMGFGALWNFLWPGRIQCYGIAATPLLVLYNGERGRKSKYFFYLFYPVHLMVLYIIYRYIS